MHMVFFWITITVRSSFVFVDRILSHVVFIFSHGLVGRLSENPSLINETESLSRARQTANTSVSARRDYNNRLTLYKFHGRRGISHVLAREVCFALSVKRYVDHWIMMGCSIPFHSFVIPSSLAQQSSCRRGTDHLRIISFMALPYGQPFACK